MLAKLTALHGLRSEADPVQGRRLSADECCELALGSLDSPILRRSKILYSEISL